MPTVRRWFPIRAKVAAYRDFIKENRRFLVIATPGYPEDWLLTKIKDDGGEVHLLQDQPTGYRDRELFEVVFPGT